MLSPNKMNPPTETIATMSGDDLVQFLASRGIVTDRYLLLDANYSLPTRSWVFGPFAKSLQTLFWNLRMYEWVSEENDCDNFSFMGFGFAQLLHHLTTRKVLGTALALGTFLFIPAGEVTGHVVLFAVVSDNGKPELVFLEPQPPHVERPTTDQEIQSCYGFVI